MKNTIFLSILVLLFLSCERNYFEDPVSPSVVKVRGLLIDNKFKVPIYNQTFYIESIDTLISLDTDSNGNFQINSLDTGNYVIYTKFHFQSKFQNMIIDDYYITDTLSHISTDSTNWRIACSYLGKVEGNVYLPSEHPKESTFIVLPDSTKIYVTENGNYQAYLKPYVEHKFKVSNPHGATISRVIENIRIRKSQLRTLNIELHSMYDFYPTQIGNKWTYEYRYSGDMHSNSSIYYREVIGDTIFDDFNETYIIFQETNPNGVIRKTEFIRIDDNNACVYSFNGGIPKKTLSFETYKLISNAGKLKYQYLIEDHTYSSISKTVYELGIGLVEEINGSMWDSRSTKLVSAEINSVKK